MELWKRHKGLSEYQWLLLQRLLSHNTGIRYGFEMMVQIYPENTYIRRINEGLSSGIELKNLLMHDSFEKELLFYLEYLPLDKSILLVNANRHRQKKLQQLIINKLSYQIMLVLCAMGLLWLFSGLVLPNMVHYMSLDTAHANSLILAFEVLNTIRNVLIGAVIVIVLFLAYVVIWKRQTYVWVILHRLGKDKLIRIFVTYRFVQKLMVLLKQGVSIIESIAILRYNRDDPMVALLAHHFDETLLKGTDFQKSLENEFFDDEFHSVCLLGLQNDNFLEALEDYEYMVEIKTERIIRIMSTAVQVITYMVVGAVIMLGYMVLLLPLEMLQ